MNLFLGPLPPGWEQGETQDGEIYFINHHDKNTTWYDPRVPIDLQKSVPHRVPGSGRPPLQPQRPSRESQQLRLQILENERREIQQRQAEILRLENERKQKQLQLQLQQRSANSDPHLQAAQDMLMRQSLNENVSMAPTSVANDPFLNTGTVKKSSTAAYVVRIPKQSLQTSLTKIWQIPIK